MEEIRSLALSYYGHGGPEIKKMFQDFFEEMDLTGKGSVTKAQFTFYLKENCPEIFNPDLFTELDKDGSGSLDFEEIVTFCYMVTLRMRWCDGKNCRKLIKSVYFGCAACFFDMSQQGSFDLCLGCYGNKNYEHEHEYFLDNYVMLTIAQNEWKKKEPEKPKQMEKEISTSPSYHSDTNASRSVHGQPGIAPYRPPSTMHEPYYNPYQGNPAHSFPDHYPYQEMNALNNAYASYMQQSKLMNSFMVPSYSGIHSHNQPNAYSQNESSLLQALKAFNTLGDVVSLASVSQCTIM